jgi:competence ComEA-like helix-hairpin-helix protein
MSEPGAKVQSSYQAGAVLFLALFCFIVVWWLRHPVERARIEPGPTRYRINVNTADAATLGLLSGISTTISQYIISYRETHGPFKSLADLDRVSRIGPTTLQKIAPYISFD